MRARKPGIVTWLPLAATLLFVAAPARAETGIDVNASSSHETFSYTSGDNTVNAQRITLSPWWSGESWELSADVPLVARESTFSGTVLVWRLVNRRWVQVPVTVAGSESDSGVGDAYLNATRRWQMDGGYSLYASAQMRLPTGTGSNSAGTMSASSSVGSSSRSFNNFTLGGDGVDLRLAPGATFAGTYLWATLEPAWILTTAAGQSDRAAAYAGAGLTPWRFLEISAAFDYEGESIAGAGILEQWTYTLTLKPTRKLSASVATYTEGNADSNWTLGIAANW